MKCKGRVVVSALLENPVDILEDVLVNYVEVGAESIDDVNFDVLRSELEFFSCRRYIGKKISSAPVKDIMAVSGLITIELYWLIAILLPDEDD